MGLPNRVVDNFTLMDIKSEWKWFDFNSLIFFVNENRSKRNLKKIYKFEMFMEKFNEILTL